MASSSYQSRDADIDMGRLFGALWRDKWLIVIGALILTGLVAAGLSFLTPQYRSDARVLIETGESVFTRPEQEVGTDQVRLDQQAVASQVQIITSSDLLMQVAGDLDLASRTEFNDHADAGAIRRTLALFGLGSDPALAPTEKRVLEAMRERLDVYAIDQSRVIVIEFRSSDPELAARVPNALAQAYVALESRAQLEGTQAAAQYLETEIAGLETELRQTEAAIAAFRASSGLLVGDNSTVLTTQQLAELSSELSRVRAERASVEARVRSIEAALAGGAALDTLPDVIASPLIERLAEQQVNLNADLADASTTLLAGHPRIQALQSQIADIEARQREQAQRILSGLRNEAAIARDREDEINGALNTLKAASAQANEREVELRALERQADSQQALLEGYLVRFREAQSRDEGQYAPATARVISTATVPVEASFPRMAPMTAAAFVIALLIMVLATLMRELFSGRALVPAAAASAGTAARAPAGADGDEPAFAARRPQPETGLMADAEDEAARAGPSDEETFSLDAVASNLVRRGAGRALMVTPIEGIGAHNGAELARRIDAKGLRTILVDLSGAGRGGAHMLDVEGTPGITDLLAAQASYADVIHRDLASGAHVMPAGVADPDLAMRGIARLPIILDGLADAYEMVIVDCGMTDADGLRQLVSADAEIVLSVDSTVGDQAAETVRDLAEGGFDELLILVADPDDDPDPGSETVELATAHRAYR